MKQNLLFFLLLLFVACNNDKEIPLSFSGDEVINVDSDEHTLRIGVQSTSEWNVTGASDWCRAEIIGPEKDSLLIHVDVNLLEEGRNATLQIANAEEKKEIQIRQAGATGEYHYRLPVIFHILCYQEVVVDKELEDRLLYALEKVNEMYRGNNGKSLDMNVEFFPATHDPDGKVLERAGIHWRAHDVEKIHYQALIDNDYGDIDWMWDPNKYLSIYVFDFHDTGTYGATPLPVTPVNHALEGLPTNDRYFMELPTYEIQCVMINRETFNDTIPTPFGNQDKGVITIAHELGHYLGVLHPFSETIKVETDYCEDTPDYFRLDYGAWKMTHPEANWYERVQRKDREGNSFTARNIMDYWDCYFEEFTPEQRKRVRHVLNYSPLVPGPKIPVELSLESKSKVEKRRVIVN